MQRRAVERINSDIEVKFFCSNTDYSGTAINISEMGMFITTEKMCFPFDSQFDVIIPLKNEILCVPVKVNRMTKSGNHFDGIAVEILDPPQNYLDFIKNLKSSA